MNEINETIARQINAKELSFAKFNLISDDKNNALIINKGNKTLKISYKYDTYTVRIIKIRKFKVILDQTDEYVYDVDLRSRVESFFKFEYVMDGIVIKTEAI